MTLSAITWWICDNCYCNSLNLPNVRSPGNETLVIPKSWWSIDECVKVLKWKNSIKIKSFSFERKCVESKLYQFWNHHEFHSYSTRALCLIECSVINRCCYNVIVIDFKLFSVGCSFTWHRNRNIILFRYGLKFPDSRVCWSDAVAKCKIANFSYFDHNLMLNMRFSMEFRLKHLSNVICQIIRCRRWPMSLGNYYVFAQFTCVIICHGKCTSSSNELLLFFFELCCMQYGWQSRYALNNYYYLENKCWTMIFGITCLGRREPKHWFRLAKYYISETK